MSSEESSDEHFSLLMHSQSSCTLMLLEELDFMLMFFTMYFLLLGHFLDQKRLKQGLYRHPWDDISYVMPETMGGGGDQES